MFEGFLEKLLEYDSHLIVTHARPDGDAVGSQLALGRLLSLLDKRVIMANVDPAPHNVSWLDPAGSIEIFDGSPLQLVRFGEVDAVTIVDANSPNRLGELQDLVAHHAGARFVIDHHLDPDDNFHAAAIDTSATSTGELIFRLFSERYSHLIDPDIAVALYVAIMTDTGSFRYGNIGQDLHNIVGALFERGDFTADDVYNRVYKTRSVAGQRLLGESLQTLRMVLNDRVGYISVTRRMFDKTDSSSDDVDAFTDFVLAIEDVQVAVMFMEVGTNVKLSFRSQGNVPVNEIAARLGGGGHRNAAGAFVQGSIESVQARVTDLLATVLRPTVSNP